MGSSAVRQKGERIRFLLAAPGLDGHDLGIRLFARSLLDAGIEVVFLGLRQKIEDIVKAAEEEDVDVIGLSVWAGIHVDAVKEIVPLLKGRGMGDIPVLVGGTIPPQDVPKLIEAGAKNAFVPGVPTEEIIQYIRHIVSGEEAPAPPRPQETKEAEPAPVAEKEWVTEDAKIPIKEFYTHEDLSGLDVEKDLGVPGTFPYTRGIYPSLYRDYMWQVRQYCGFGLPEQTNERARFIVEQGGRGRGGVAVLNIIHDQPTHLGYDSDDPESRYDVGRVGVAIDNIEDMEKIFEGLDLENIFYNFPAYSLSNAFWAMYVGLARKKGVSQDKLKGATINAPIESYICGMKGIFPPLDGLRLGLDLMEYACKTSRRFSAITLSANNLRETGCYNYQSIAWGIAEGIAYSQGLVQRGLNIDDFASMFSFYGSTERDFFEEIAKYRALRRIWATEMKRRFNPKKPRSMVARTTCRTCGGMLTAQQPLVNIVRSTIQALASLLGGVQSVTITPYDEVLSIPSKEAMTMALRQHEVLGYESGIRSTSDPFGGSYFMETLTSQYEAKVREEIDNIEKLGAGEEYGPPMLTGVIKALESGYFRTKINEASYERKKAIDRGGLVIVGVNKSTEEEEVPLNIEQADPTIREIKIKRLQEFRKRRSMDEIQRALDRLRKAAETDENVMEPMIDAFLAGATIQEVYRDTLMEVFGRWDFWERTRLT